MSKALVELVNDKDVVVFSEEVEMVDNLQGKELFKYTQGVGVTTLSEDVLRIDVRHTQDSLAVTRTHGNETRSDIVRRCYYDVVGADHSITVTHGQLMGAVVKLSMTGYIDQDIKYLKVTPVQTV